MILERISMMNTIASRIIWLRESHGLNQADFSEKVGVTQSNISRIENGTQKPSADTLVALSHFFGVTTDWILFGDSSQDNKDEDFLDVITDVELQKIFIKIREQWITGDDAERGWIKVQLRKAFPEIAEETKKGDA
jgi:transcriptional regulator with XRE-family HTH domain